MSKLAAPILAVAGAVLVIGLAYRGHRFISAVNPSLVSSAPVNPGAVTSAGKASASGVTSIVSRSEKLSPPAALANPLRAGEVLEFVADVSKLTNVADLRLAIVEQRNFFGKSAWHLQAVAHTENPLRMVFELDDQFDSYSELSSLSTLQYEMHLNERGEKVDSIQRMTSSGEQRSPQNITQTRVLPGTRDPLAFLAYLRTVTWTELPEVRSPVYDGHKLYDVRASYQGKAFSITVPAGSFSSSKIEVRVFDAGAEVKDAHFVLYLAENPARTPVLLEAVMPFAAARVALAKMR